MKLGAIVRAEDRGIAIQSWEFCRAMQPERTLLIDMGDLARGFPVHKDRYPDATVVHYDRGLLPEDPVREFLDGLDVVFTVETFYDWRVCRWADEAGVATVCQVNPEFMRPVEELPACPTRWWAPTSWRLGFLPEGTRVVPVPVAGDRFPLCPPEPAEQLRVLHVAGHRAMADRNGTTVVLEALRRLRPPMRVTIATQDARLPSSARGRRGGIEVEAMTGGVRDYWRLYDDQDVLVMPRRYGGLCLPVQEAMAAGLAVVMTDAEPQRSTWPVLPIRAGMSRPKLRCPGGPLPMATPRPEATAEQLNALADPSKLRCQQEQSVAWAKANSWDALRPLYEQELADVCTG